ncbi:baseplate J/gp47 family protein [Draconibacterium halophilum]|uniref:Phage baseplate protein n=1 Tax=Draconibacterium halophilum TaxID=2706887 RepID=A0A6C0REI0_9BACT|nr:phage baseplate protein [Draconibacterium halophilum]QIA08477.1 phage baseplate protein [Draconibacterium halophilum]
MANCGKDILLSREGTEQQLRFIEALDPAWVKLNDFGLGEWMKFAWDFAKHVNYFDTKNEQVPADNWQDFFIAKDELTSFLADIEKGSEITPHLALFVSFIKLLDTTKKHFNHLSKRHLDFYYKRVLQLEKQPATPDTVHVLFELAKNAESELIAESTALDAGKDSGGKKLIYKTSEELVANRAKVAALKSIYNDHEYQKIKSAEVANSFDGAGADFPDKNVKWWPFAYYELPPEGDEPDLREYPELPNAKVGFAVAGEILELQEGERYVQLTLDFDTVLSKSYSFDDLKANLKILITGEKGWLESGEIVESFANSAIGVNFTSGSNASDLSLLHILFQIPKDEKAIVAYDKKIHAENFDTQFPVCRVLINTGSETGHELYRDLVDKKLNELAIDVAAIGVENHNLYNDIGTINAAKPFYPFGTQPVKKSKFYVDYAELYKKKWNKLNINVEWKNTPENFRTWYAAYRGAFKNKISASDYLKGILSVDYLDSITQSMQFRAVTDIGNIKRTTPDFEILQFNDLIVSGDSYFTAAVELNEKEEWTVQSELNNKVLFEGPDDGIFSLSLDVSNPLIQKDKAGPLRLSLNKTFLHEMYPRLYALAMSSEDENVLIPNEPYTPFIEKLTLDYTASAQIKLKDDEYEFKDFALYHEHPFGQALEDIEQKIANKILQEDEAKIQHAVPTYCNGGELYIGLENAKAQQNVSLLIQVLEGSENPETESFVGKQKVEWWMLCSNEWKRLERSSIIFNQTDNLLKSGILKFKIPKEATDNNTLLPGGLMWLKARIHKKYNAVSKVIGIHAQAVEAKFENNNNKLDHLNDGLSSNTISKMVVRPPRIKSLSQPYSSFGGQPTESDSAFYRRVSERLRHKNRAITLWDYEHLVLQEFPEIHKVKCLNHTSTKVEKEKRITSYLAPGNVVLVVIPDIVNRNVFDIYKPRVSKATLNRIENFIRKLNAPLISTKVINPEYEEVRVDLKVQFYEGYDEVYYKTVLKEDLIRLLSPWAFDSKALIQFGLSLHKSIVIDYVEKLKYVDFVSDLKLFQTNAATGKEVEVKIASPNSPEAILVSSKLHRVNDIENNCSNTTIEPAESCQS